MKLVKQISAILLGVLFLMSSSGFMIYKSKCSCTGNEQVSLFVNSEICKSETTEVEKSCCAVEETTQCQSHTNDCDCDSPEVTYFKLKNQVINEEVKFTLIQPIEFLVLYSSLQFDYNEDSRSVELDKEYNDPPPLIESSHDFLIQIQQLKIPLNA